MIMTNKDQNNYNSKSYKNFGSNHCQNHKQNETQNRNSETKNQTNVYKQETNFINQTIVYRIKILKEQNLYHILLLTRSIQLKCVILLPISI